MDNKAFSKLLEKRTRDFGIKIIRLSTVLPNTPEGREIRRQITKSGTSVGANYREANRARSRADFKSRIKICESEASETQYWLLPKNNFSHLNSLVTLVTLKRDTT